MKMAGLLWVTVVLTFLSPGLGVNTVDKNKLAKIVDFMMKRYDINYQVSVAVNIPDNQDLDKLQEVFANTKRVQNSLSSVYVDDNMVAAKPDFQQKYTEHAEARVLNNMNTLEEKAKNHFLVFYTFNSPCGGKCMNPNNNHNIIDKMKTIFNKWREFAFVFFKVFDETSDHKKIPNKETTETLKDLGNTIGHDKVFRCYKQKTIKCINCFKKKEPVPQCLSNNVSDD